MHEPWTTMPAYSASVMVLQEKYENLFAVLSVPKDYFCVAQQVEVSWHRTSESTECSQALAIFLGAFSS